MRSVGLTLNEIIIPERNNLVGQLVFQNSNWIALFEETFVCMCLSLSVCVCVCLSKFTYHPVYNSGVTYRILQTKHKKCFISFGCVKLLFLIWFSADF